MRRCIPSMGLLAAILAAGLLLAPLASDKPDGLERVAEDHGFHAQEKPAAWHSPFEGYGWLGQDNSWGTRLSAAVGTAVAFGAVVWLFRSLAARRPGKRETGQQAVPPEKAEGGGSVAAPHHEA